MSSGKSGGGSKDFYGHVAGVVCQGQLDFIWGMMLNNELAWPSAKLWDSQIYKKNVVVIYTDGNVYTAAVKTDVDPPTFPWTLTALPWAAGSFDEGEKVLHNGHVWESAVDANANEPPENPPALPILQIQVQSAVDGWLYVCTPQAWSAGENFWAANSIVAWKGQLWTTAAGTKAEPPASPWTLWKVDRSGSDNPLKFTVEDRGDVYLYWGTGDQVLDESDEAVLNALGHPPYRHRAVLVLKDFLFGTMQATPPDVTILGGRVPEQSLIAGDAAALDADWQVNPWCVLAELLTHPVLGLGLPAEWFDSTSWQAEADWCLDNHELTYISPMYSSLQKVRSLVADLLGYPDAFLFWSTVATLVAGHWPHGEAAPAFTAATTIDMHDLVSPIADTSDGWGATSDSVVVSIRDIQAGFKARPVAASNLFNRTITRQLQSQRIDRPHIVRFNQGAAWATELAKLAGEQKSAGTLTVRAEKATSIVPGTLFLLTDDQFGTSEVCRCIRKVLAAPPDGTAKLTYETERGISPPSYYPTPDNPTAEQGPAPTPILNAHLFQAPSELAGGPDHVICLAARTNAFTSGFDIWFRYADGAAFQKLATQAGFGIPGKVGYSYGNVGSPEIFESVEPGDSLQLAGTDIYHIALVRYDPTGGTDYSVGAAAEIDWVYDPTARTILVLPSGAIPSGASVAVTYVIGFALLVPDSVPAEDIETISAPLTDDEIADRKLLLILFREDDPTLFEIMAVKSVTAAGGYYECSVIGGQYGTQKGGDGAHLFEQWDWGFIIPRESMIACTHAAFQGLQRAGGTGAFRLAALSAWVEGDVADVYDPADNPSGLTVEYPHTFNDPYAPVASWQVLQANDADIADFTAEFDFEDEFHFTFELSDLDADLASARLIARKGATERLLWSQILSGGSAIYDMRFVIDAEGDWRIVLVVTDRAGRITEQVLTEVGETSEVFLRVRPPGGSSVVANPTATITRAAGGFSVELACSTSGATIEYQIGALYQAPGGTWTSYTGAFLAGKFRSVHARAVKSGMTTSPVVTWNLWL